MADGTESQVSDGANADGPKGTDARILNADTDRVARIVAALRKAHAEQAAASSSVSEAPSAEAPSGAAAVVASSDAVDAPAPRRETSGVRPPAPTMPTLRWNPGVRYRASRLADRPALPAPSAPAPEVPAAGTAGHLPVPPPPVPGPPVALPPVPLPPVPGPPASPYPAAAHPVPAHPVAGPPPLAGRLFRGPARRTGVFEREIWNPQAARSSRVPRDVSDALVRAVERYRMGSISTSGLVQAIGRAHAA
jgi:hypothetical protein